MKTSACIFMHSGDHRFRYSTTDTALTYTASKNRKTVDLTVVQNAFHVNACAYDPIGTPITAKGMTRSKVKEMGEALLKLASQMKES